MSVDGAKVLVDYTSQIGKDLQKRRSWLFELTLSNNVVYLLQAPNNTQRAQWSVLQAHVHVHAKLFIGLFVCVIWLNQLSCFSSLVGIYVQLVYTYIYMYMCRIESGVLEINSHPR